MIESKTFEKLEAQRVLVELLLKVDPAADAEKCNKKLTSSEIVNLSRLAEPYDVMDDEFPIYVLSITRENL